MRVILMKSLVFLVVCAAVFVGCGSIKTVGEYEAVDHYEKSDTIVVDLKGFTDNKVVVYTNDPVRVIVSYNSLMDDLALHIQHYDVQYDKDLENELLDMAQQSDTLDMAKIIDKRMLHERFAFRLAEILERGEAEILNTKTGERIEKILVEHYEVMFHKLAGRGGRLFLLMNKTIFLEVTDWIS